MSGYGGQPPPKPVVPDEPCAIHGCDGESHSVYGTHLCMPHGIQANHVRDETGLPSAQWDDVVQVIRQWVENQNQRKRKAGGT